MPSGPRKLKGTGRYSSFVPNSTSSPRRLNTPSWVALCLGIVAFCFLLAPSLLFLSSTSLSTLLITFPFLPSTPPLNAQSQTKPPPSPGVSADSAKDGDSRNLPGQHQERGSEEDSSRGGEGEARDKAEIHSHSQSESESESHKAMAALTAAASAALGVPGGASFASRKVVRKLLSKEQDEGDGARVRRSIGRPEMKTLDPFLLLDEFRVTPPAGFPDHPHRGFETVTYMLKGRFHHEDFDGHQGVIGPGDLQWMTAGKGIMHAEMPANVGESHGLQLWVNLAKKDKMVPSSYQELLDKDVPKVERDGVRVAVIAGESMGVSSPVHTRTPTMYLSFSMQPGSHLRQAIPQGWNAFVYTLTGEATLGEETAEATPPHYTVQLGPGDGIEVWNRGEKECSFVLIGGQPLGEPVVQYGPFVMNTEEEIMMTLRDLQGARNGFEKARGWRSSIYHGVN